MCNVIEIPSQYMFLAPRPHRLSFHTWHTYQAILPADRQLGWSRRAIRVC